jgi:hypothetical protein
MSEERNIPEQQEQLTPNQHIRNDWRALVDKVSYKGIVNNVPFMAFLVLLCVLYITNNQRTIETQRALNKKHDELKELRWKYMDIKSQLMSAGMETEVIRTAFVIGLKPMTLPAFRIKKDTVKTVSN